MADFSTVTVTSVEPLTDDSVAVAFDSPAPFRPGQSVVIRRTINGREERRNYSICSADRVRIGVREVPDGAFSQWLVHEIRPGDEVEISEPTGRFALPEDTGQWAGHHLLIGAGSGITPLLAIAEGLLRADDTRVTLIYGNRRTNTVMFAEELADLKDAHGPRLELLHVLSREPREVELFSGRLDVDRTRRILEALVRTDDVAGVWLCGPFELVSALRPMLVDHGIAAERIHAELFYVDDVPPPPVRHADETYSGPVSAVTITLDGRSTELNLPQDQPILDGAQQHRADLPFACKGGVCGTCRAKVLAGEVDLRRNYALEPEEVAAGFVLTCQSYPVSDTVVVDFDT